MNGLGDQFLAGTGLTLYQNGGVGGGDQPDLMQHILQSVAGSNDALEARYWRGGVQPALFAMGLTEIRRAVSDQIGIPDVVVQDGYIVGSHKLVSSSDVHRVRPDYYSGGGRYGFAIRAVREAISYYLRNTSSFRLMTTACIGRSPGNHFRARILGELCTQIPPDGRSARSDRHAHESRVYYACSEFQDITRVSGTRILRITWNGG
jgi:hypothetical protein